VRSLVSTLLFPLVFVVAIGTTLYALETGVPGATIVPVISLGTIILVVLCERLLPYYPAWNKARGDLSTDAIYLPLTVGINAALEPFVKTIAVVLSGYLTAFIGMGLWPTRWPLAAQFGIACVIAELFDYFAHRVMHENEWLWRLHATHHSSARLYWLNATRAHPGEMLFRGTLGVLPLAFLGAEQDVFILLGIVNIVVGVFQHANIDFKLGPLSWIFSIGDLHRWHHSRERSEHDRNYGNNFIFWDTLFGTRFLPPGRRPPDDIGIDHFPRTVTAQILAPLRWNQIERLASPSIHSGGA
jgi:sterol desaturase/sphingolipid hydroxylase (fatty acid hydroxylase superfamily)